MEQNTQVFLNLLKQAITATPCHNIELLAETDWVLIEKLAMKHKSYYLMCDEIYQLATMGLIPKDVGEKWKEKTIGHSMGYIPRFLELRSLVNALKNENVQYVLFKGCVLAELYPQASYRMSGDVDILIEESEIDKAAAIVEELGFSYLEKDSGEMVYAFISLQTGQKIELHMSLWEELKGIKIQKLRNMGIDSKDSWISMMACGLQIKTLGFTEHLIYQIFHMLKHYFLDGMNIKFGIDITFYINAYYDRIDWKDFWEKIHILEYEHLCDEFFTLCISHLGLKPDVMKDRICNIDRLWNIK